MPVCSPQVSQICISTRIYDQLFPCIFNTKVIKLLIAAKLIVEKGYSIVIFILISFTVNVVDTQHSFKSPFKHTFIHCRGWKTIRNTS